MINDLHGTVAEPGRVDGTSRIAGPLAGSKDIALVLPVLCGSRFPPLHPPSTLLKRGALSQCIDPVLAQSICVLTGEHVDQGHGDDL
jgi:hypothetical protein